MSFQGHDQLFPSKQAEPHTPNVGELVAGKYRVEAQLGSGGMGAVLSARHEQLGQIVALKVLHPTACEDPDAVARFMREARSAASLESEHVVRIFDVGTSEHGSPFMVMERLVGFDLAQTLDQHGPLDANLAALCVYQAALGVADAHDNGIIHRDLKPSNLFLVKKRDGAPLIKVLDFGISKALDANANVHLTQTRTIVGSPLYMSPEQVRDARRVDARSDVWSLGVILHELLSGRPAFDGDTLPAVCARIVADPPGPIMRTDVPSELLEVVDRCLQKDPSFRYQSARALIDALRPLLRDVSEALALLGVPSAQSFPRNSSVSFPSTSGANLVGTVVDNAPTRVSNKQAVDQPPPAPPASTTLPVSSGTMAQSAAALSRSSASLAPLSGTGSRRLWLTIAGLGAAAGVGAFVLLQAMKPPAADPAPVQQSANMPAEAPASFRIVSVPEGAEVFEGQTSLGKTPLTLQSRGAVGSMRTLQLRMAGHEPYELELRPTNRDAEVRVELKPEAPKPAEVASAAAEEKPAPPATVRTISAAKKPAAKPAAPKPAAPTPAPAKPADLDIRMKR